MITHQNKEQQNEIRDRSNEQNDSIVFGPPTLEERIEVMKRENERLLHELQESKSKERIYKCGLERFSSFILDFLTNQLKLNFRNMCSSKLSLVTGTSCTNESNLRPLELATLNLQPWNP